MDGSGTVQIPECYIMASSYMDAIKILNQFLQTKIINNDIELITPIERICFNI